MNESLLARKITERLDSVAVSPEIAARLRVARERALDRHHVTEADLALAGARSARVGTPTSVWPRILLPVALLIAAAIGLHQWQAAQQTAWVVDEQAAEFAEIDAGLLAGDLPIKAYLDEDFLSWLKRSSE